MLLNDKGLEVFVRRLDKYGVWQGNYYERSVEKSLKLGFQVEQDKGTEIAFFYINARNMKNKCLELKSYVSLEKSENFLEG